jgi:hypothetical protein
MSEMASNESDRAYEGAKAEFKLWIRNFEEAALVASGTTVAPDIFTAKESSSAKEVERATYQTYSIRPTKGSIDNSGDDNGRWEITESTLETLDTDQIANEVTRLGQTGESLVISGQMYSSTLPNQRNGIEKLLNELRKEEPLFEFSVAEVKVKEMGSEGVKRTEAITVVVKRCPGGQIGDRSTNKTEVGKPESETVVQANDSRDDPPAKPEIDVSAEVEDEIWRDFAAKKNKKKKRKRITKTVRSKFRRKLRLRPRTMISGECGDLREGRS